MNEADEALQNARSSLQNTLDHLNFIVVQKCEGTEEYKDESLQRFRRVFVKLLECRDEL